MKSKEVVQEHLATLNAFRFSGPCKHHPRILKALADLTPETLSNIILENSRSILQVMWLEVGPTCPRDWKGEEKVNPGKFWLISLALMPGKVLKRTIKCSRLGTRSIMGFSETSRAKLIISFCDTVISLVDAGNIVDAVCLDFYQCVWQELSR